MTSTLEVPAGWPVRSLGEIEALLCAPGAPFEMEVLEVRGVPTRVWKNAPASLAALAAVGRSNGDATFLVYEDERVTFAAWHKAVAKLAGELQRLGVAKGDRVALASRNLPEWPVVFFSTTVLGAICVPLNAWWTGPELSYGLSNSGAKVLVCDGERLARIEPHLAELPDLATVIVTRQAEAPAGVLRLEDLIGTSLQWPGLPDIDLPQIDIASDDPATILYTSGTTGNPKGALGTHRNLTSNIMSSGYAAARSVLRRENALPEPAKKVLLTVIPLFHATACSATLMGAIAGGHTIVLMYKWDPVHAFQIIEREKVNATGGVPTIAWQLIEHPDRDKYDLSSIETIGYGGAPSAPELVKKIHEVFGALPGNGWGMTETSATVTTHSAEDYLNRPTSCGPAVAAADLEIRAEDGVTVLPSGEIGELWARGPMIVAGYWQNPDASAATFVDGWVRTGDLAWLDEEGFCFIADRAKDMVIRGGENIYSS
ncbi:MAG: class I adenylate-forming enzyme family protein, partial [Novosphingobium sp.]